MRRPAMALVLVLASIGSLLGARADAQLGPPSARPAPGEPSTFQSGAHRMFVDVKGDGFDLEACSATTRRRGPRASADERLLAIDVAEAAKVGFRVAAISGSLGRAAPFGDGLRITVPTGAAHDTSDGWVMLSVLDSNKDGLLDASDLVWAALRLARDADGDGLLDGAEVEPVGAIDAVRFGPRSPTRTERDAHGSELAFGVFAKRNGSLGRVADVLLATCARSP